MRNFIITFFSIAFCSFLQAQTTFTMVEIDDVYTSGSLGDFDKDGFLDLLGSGAASSSDSIFIMYHSDSIFFDSIPTCVIPNAGNTYSSTIADMNGDTYVDLVISYIDRVSIYYNQAGVGFGPEVIIDNTLDRAYRMESAFINGDNLLDIICMSLDDRLTYSILQLPGGGFTTQRMTGFPSSLTDVKNYDPIHLNDDGVTDFLFSADNDLQFGAVISDGLGYELQVIDSLDTSIPYSTWSLTAVGDYFDSDDQIDVFGISGLSNVMYFGDDSTYIEMGIDTPLTFSPTGQAWTILLGNEDMDNDGDVDIVTISRRTSTGGNNTVYLYVYFNDGTGHFSRELLSMSSKEYQYGDVFDKDGDGDMDILVGNNGGIQGWNTIPPTLELWVNNLPPPAPCASTEAVAIQPGWNIISSYIIPDDLDFETIISEVASNIILIKNSAGEILLPGIFNQIGEWSIFEGYQVKASAPITLTVGCTEASPELVPIPVNSGWNMISYLRTSPMNADVAWAGISSDIILAKDNNGNIFLPGLLNQIGELQPGQGYQVKMAASTSLTYPAN